MKIKIFGEGNLSNVLRNQLLNLSKEVYAEDKNKLLNMNESEYLTYLVSKYKIDPLEFDWNNITISDTEANVESRNSPMGRFIAGQPDYYRRQIITYHIPFGGEADLLRYLPSTRIMWTTEVEVSKDKIGFSIINWNNNAEEIKGEADQTIKNIREQAGHVNGEVGIFNQDLEAEYN